MTIPATINAITSERLLLRRFMPDDLEFLVTLHSSELVTRYIGHGRPRFREESVVWLNTVLKMYREYGMGQLAVVRKSDGRLIGRCGLWLLHLESNALPSQLPRAWFFDSHAPSGCVVTDVAELGYTFDAAYWGQGYASEAARTVIEYVRAATPAQNVVSLIHPDNARSSRLIARFDARHDGWVECMGQRLHLYRW